MCIRDSLHPGPTHQRIGLGGLVSLVRARAAEWHVRAAGRRACRTAQLHPGAAGFHRRAGGDLRLVVGGGPGAIAVWRQAPLGGAVQG